MISAIERLIGKFKPIPGVAMKVVTTAVMNIAGIVAIQCSFLFLARYTGSPEHNSSQGLICPAQITLDQGKIGKRNNKNNGKEWKGDQPAIGLLLLGTRIVLI